MAKPNFEFQKRQKELEKKRKKEEKKQRKLDRAAAPPAEGAESADSTATPPPSPVSEAPGRPTGGCPQDALRDRVASQGCASRGSPAGR